MKKASDLEISEAYLNLKSCKKVADIFNMCPQSVHERVVRMGINTPLNKLTQEEKELIKKVYLQGFERGDGLLLNLSKKIKRTIPFISRFAKKEGLTNYCRKMTQQLKTLHSIQLKKWHQENDHPKGMLGKKHTPEVSKLVGLRQVEWHNKASHKQKAERADKMVKTTRENGGYDKPRGTWKSDWRTIGGKTKFFRSRWEANYARYLESLKIGGFIRDWFHEPETFWFKSILRGTRSFLPDFKVIRNDDTHYWVEVKGYMDARSKTKLKRFKKYYPNESLELVDKKWYKENSKNLSLEIEGWELDRTS